ncbi:hypothetical protein NKH77_37620 [Streptomyces sp. M19]
MIVFFFGRIGNWPEIGRRYVAPPCGACGTSPLPTPPRRPETDPAQWPELRAAGAHGRPTGWPPRRGPGMNDVDHARIEGQWRAVRNGRTSLASFTDTVLRHGAAAWRHPRARAICPRAARTTTWAPARSVSVPPRRPAQSVPAPRRRARPGPGGARHLAAGRRAARAGKTGRLVRPVVESLCLQALARRAAVVAVGRPGRGSAPTRRSTSW